MLAPKPPPQRPLSGARMKRRLERQIDAILNQANDFVNDVDGAFDTGDDTEPDSPSLCLADIDGRGASSYAENVFTPTSPATITAGPFARPGPSICIHHLSRRGCRLGVFCRLRHTTTRASAVHTSPAASPTTQASLVTGTRSECSVEAEDGGGGSTLHRWVWLENAAGYDNTPPQWHFVGEELEAEIERKYTSSTPPPSSFLFAGQGWLADSATMTALCLRSRSRRMLQRIRVDRTPVWCILQKDARSVQPLPPAVAEAVEARYLGRPEKLRRTVCDDAHHCSVVLDDRALLIDMHTMEVRCPRSNSVLQVMRQPVQITVACPAATPAEGYPDLARRAAFTSAPPAPLLFVHNEDGEVRIHAHRSEANQLESACAIDCAAWQPVPQVNCATCEAAEGAALPVPSDWRPAHLTAFKHECPRGRKCLFDCIDRDRQSGRASHWAPHWIARAQLHCKLLTHTGGGPAEFTGNSLAKDFRGRWDLSAKEGCAFRAVERTPVRFAQAQRGQALRMIPSRSPKDGHCVCTVVSVHEEVAVVRWAAAHNGGPALTSAPTDKQESRDWWDSGGRVHLEGEWDWVISHARNTGLQHVCDPSARVSIERLANRSLWVQWRSARRDIAARNGGDANELALWCTVRPYEVPALLQHGFDSGRRLVQRTHDVRGGQPARGSAGNGRHFYRRAAEADLAAPADAETGEKMLVLALVCAGSTHWNADPSRIVPEQRGPTRGVHCRFHDSTCDAASAAEASCFVVYDGPQAYPMYVVTYMPKRRRSKKIVVARSHQSLSTDTARSASVAVKKRGRSASSTPRPQSPPAKS